MSDTEKMLPTDELKRVIGTPEGRKVMRAILGNLGLFRQPYVVGDPTTTAYNCGGLNYALVFFDECQSAAPELTAIMLRELKNDGPTSNTSRDDSEHSLNRHFDIDPDDDGPYIGKR